MERIAKISRASLWGLLILGTGVLTSYKLFDKPPQWLAVMKTLESIYHPKMSIYMIKVPSRPFYIVDVYRLNPGLRKIELLRRGNRDDFVKKAKQNYEFVFLERGLENIREYRRRRQYLLENGYVKKILRFRGIEVHIYSRSQAVRKNQLDSLTERVTTDALLLWLQNRLKKQPPITNMKNKLEKAFVGRTGPKATLTESLIYEDLQKKGRRGSWIFGTAAWESVSLLSTTSGKVLKEMIWAHPRNDGGLILGFPKIQLGDELEIIYGLADSGLGNVKGAPVNLDLFIDYKKEASLTAANEAGWKKAMIETKEYSGLRRDILFFITSPDQNSRHFCFDFNIAAPSVPKLTETRSLKTWVEQLKIYRITREGKRINPLRFDKKKVSAQEMHEFDAASLDEGWLDQRWVLGKKDWDSVGRTHQRIDDKIRDGIWAHPKDGTILVIETPRWKVGNKLKGYVGLTDYSVKRSKIKKITAPVKFQIFVDGRKALEKKIKRKKEISDFKISVPEGASEEKTLRVEIKSAKDSWAHLVFDLWSPETK